MSSSDSELKPRERRQRRTKAAILDAARKLLIKGGPDGVSLRAIAREIDYSAAGLYEYFDSKEDIIQAVSRQGIDLLATALRGADATKPFPEFLLEVGLAYLQFARTNPDHFMLSFTTVPQGNQIDELRDSPAFGTLVEAVERGIDEGIFDIEQRGLGETAMVFWSAVHGLAMLEQTQLKGADLDFEQIGLDVCTNIYLGLTNNQPADAGAEQGAASQ